MPTKSNLQELHLYGHTFITVENIKIIGGGSEVENKETLPTKSLYDKIKLLGAFTILKYNSDYLSIIITNSDKSSIFTPHIEFSPNLFSYSDMYSKHFS